MHVWKFQLCKFTNMMIFLTLGDVEISDVVVKYHAWNDLMIIGGHIGNVSLTLVLHTLLVYKCLLSHPR